MSDDSHNFAYFGTPDVAARTLDILAEGGYTPTVIITAPDRPVGRKQIVTPPPAKLWGEAHSIPVFQPEKLDDDFFSQLATFNVQLGVAVAYGKILPKEIIDVPKLGTINIHYSLLPRWRGASPVETAILAGDEKTGIVIQKMVPKLDEGAIIVKEETMIDENETAIELRARLIEMGGKLLVQALPNIFEGKTKQIPQTGEATYCHKIKKEDGKIDLSDPDIEKWRKYRAYFGWPGIFYFDETGKRIIVKEAVFEKGTFTIKKILREGSNNPIEVN